MAVTIVKKARGEDRLSLRLSSKSKFSIELLARAKETSLSSLVLGALELKSRKELTRTVTHKDGSEDKTYLPDVIWDPLIPDRLVKLATFAPNLLTDRERVVWTVIGENGRFWITGSEPRTPRLDVIRTQWDQIQSDADALMGKHGS